MAGPETSVSVFAAGRVIPVSVDHGSITIQITDPALARMTWDGALGRVWVGDGEGAFSTYRQIFSGSLGAQSRDGQNLKVPLYGAGFEINETPILTGTYAGTGGVEGPSTLKGKRKPKAFGYCRYVTPVRINQAYVVYQVHDGAAQDIPAVYEAAVTLAAPVATVATYAELIALTLKPGEWAKAPAVGMFRLGSEPSGKLTADVRGDASGGYVSTLATIATKLLRGAGVLASDIDSASLASVANLSWCAFVTDETTVGAVIANTFAAAGAYAFPDELGVWRAGSWLNDGATITANATDGEFVIVPGSFKQEEASPPNYLVRINGDRCWSPHSSTEISPAIVELQEGAKDLLERAKAAKAVADQASADIAVEKARIDNIANDNILDTSEKGQVKLQFAVITANKPRIVSDAAGFSISSTAYEAAYAALASYLAGLSPSWSDTTVDTPIDRLTFVDRFQAEAVARQNLLSTIEIETAKRANWDGVTGANKPADNATVGAKVGDNLRDENGSFIGRDQIINAASGYSATVTYDFDNGLQGASGIGCTVVAQNGVLRITSSDSDSIVYLPVDGMGNTLQVIRARIRPTADAYSWQGQVYYSTANHSDSEGYTKSVAAPIFRKNEWTVVEWDMSRLNYGGDDFITNRILRLRFDLSKSPNETWEIDWIQLGQRFAGTHGAPVGSYVGGKPVVDVIADLNRILPIQTAQDDANRAILDTQLLAEERRKRYEDLMHVDGAQVGSVIKRVELDRIEGDRQIIDTVSLIGQKNAAGSAFILDGSTVEVSPGKSLTERLSEFSSITTTDVNNAVTSKITDYNRTLTSTTGAIATSVNALESKIAGTNGSIAAAITNYDNTTVDPNDPTSQSVANSVKSLRSTVGSQTSDIAFILRALNGNEATAQLVLNANGKVSGLRLQGSTQSISFDVKKFAIEDPDTGKVYFAADASDGGKVKMHDVEVDRIKAGSVDSPSLAMAATSRSSFATLSGDAACYYNVTTDVISFGFAKVDADSVLKVQMFAQCDHADDLIFTGQIVIDGSVVQSARVRMPFDNSNSRGSVPVTPFAFVSGIGAGSHTIGFRLLSQDTEGPTYVRAGSTLEVTELRRASAAIVQSNTIASNAGGGGGSGGGEFVFD